MFAFARTPQPHTHTHSHLRRLRRESIGTENSEADVSSAPKDNGDSEDDDGDEGDEDVSSGANSDTDDDSHAVVNASGASEAAQTTTGNQPDAPLQKGPLLYFQAGSEQGTPCLLASVAYFAFGIASV